MQNQELNITQQDIDTLLEGLMGGLTLGELAGVSEESIEALYGLAYNLYAAQNFKDASVVFQALSLYKHNDYRFLMGLAACTQALHEYDKAVEFYTYAILTSQFSEPEPFYYSAYCFLKLEQKEAAVEALQFIADIGEEGNAAHTELKVKAEELLRQLKA